MEKIYNCRKDYVKNVIADVGCEEFLRLLITEKQVYDRLTSFNSNSYVSAQGKEYIIYVLLYVLNELKSITEEHILVYLLNPDVILREIIELMHKKGWKYDISSALDFCRCVITDYVRGEGSITVVYESTQSSLEQIVSNYEPYMLDHKIGDKGFMDLYDKQLNICDGGFYGSYSRGVRDLVKKLVVHRMYDKEIF